MRGSLNNPNLKKKKKKKKYHFFRGGGGGGGGGAGGEEGRWVDRLTGPFNFFEVGGA